MSAVYVRNGLFEHKVLLSYAASMTVNRFGSDCIDWLAEYGTGQYAYAFNGGRDDRRLLFSFTDSDTAFAFKMRWG